MVKTASQYVCQRCGFVSMKWVGCCEGCGAWNTLVEEAPENTKLKKKGPALHFASLSESSKENVTRLISGIDEFDRVTGGGIVPGSTILLGGDPGIGKSTLLLQVASCLSKKLPCGYISGEEGIDQVRMRARRLGLGSAPLKLASSTSVAEVARAFKKEHFALAIIDSIQTMGVPYIDSPPGTVSQIRAASHELIEGAKKEGVALVLVGHVTKEGMLAGPRILEHMVDAVLYFEGEKANPFRILRAQKNRFGPTDELGVFDMGNTGLEEVRDPSSIFLSHQNHQTTGAAVFPGIEGSRPLLAEIQALVSDSYLTNPRRTVVGWDTGRLSMILAILQTRASLNLAAKDVYLNVVGGLRLTEPTVDLAVATALLSCTMNVPLPSDTVVFGELSLSGDIRPATRCDLRLREAEKLGFKKAITRITDTQKKKMKTTLQLTNISHIKDLKALFKDF